MLQRFRLDRPAGAAYLLLGLAACGGGPGPLAPKGLVRVEPGQVAGWVAPTTPTQPIMYRFTWLYQDEQASKGGRGSVRLVPPDSLRFDFAGSLGIGKGSAAVVGDSALWVVPDRSVDELVPGVSLLWAILGVAQPAPAGADLRGVKTTEGAAWQYIRGSDTTTYVRSAGSGSTLSAEVRREGKVLGRTSVTVRADGSPVKALLTVPTVPSKLEITFYASVPTAQFPPEIWARPSEP